MVDRQTLYSVSELAREFALTPQALRFYEEKGLLNPERVGGARVFTYRDRARLVLILKFRRLGFTLDEIRGYLRLYHSGSEQAEQYRNGLRCIVARIADLEMRRREIDEILLELRDLEREACQCLHACLSQNQAGDSPDKGVVSETSQPHCDPSGTTLIPATRKTD